MRIAIIGAGVSGNVCAWLLSRVHEVTLFEANCYAGGHTNTVDAVAYGQAYSIDTGFMVFNDRTYPQFLRLLDQLGVDFQASDMSFSVRCERTGWEYQGSSLGGLFAQRRNLVRPAFYRMLWDIARFNREATEACSELGEEVTLGDFLRDRRYGPHLVSHYLVPMTAAIWSAPPVQILQMPARFLFQFFRNHGLLQLTGRPQWRTIPGGARRYVRAMLEPLGSRVRLATPIAAVKRYADEVEGPRVELRRVDGQVELFDAVVFATHADQTLRMLTDPSDLERTVLGQFPYQRNLAILHTDASLLPRRSAAWASWNYRIGLDDASPVALTYDVNRLQRLGAPGPVCVTLNDSDSIDPDKILQQIEYHHPVFGPGTLRAQQMHAKLNGQRRTYYCGAYWRYGFHEDGVESALAVCRCFGLDLDTCTVASTKETCGTVVSSH
jgi:predicted NAD/FAD-binding protein